MNSLIRWVATVSVSLMVTAKTFGLFKKVNEVEATQHIAQNTKSALISDMDDIPLEPAVMGSEKISAVLQYIFSSKESELDSCPVYIDARNNKYLKDCVLGSESLNRMLEEIISPSANGNSSSQYIEPLIQV